MASGKTLLMRDIRKPAPQVIHRHAGAPRWVRRSKRLAPQWTGSLVDNFPYVNGSRDLKKKGKKR